MENQNTIQNINETIEQLEEAIQETINIVQLFGDEVERGKEAVYISRSIHTIEKMLKEVCNTNIPRLREIISKLIINHLEDSESNQ